MQGAPNQRHTLMEWINTTICTMWSNVAELLDTVSRWHTYAKLTQVVRKLIIKQQIFNPNNQCPDDEHFMGSIRDTILKNAPFIIFRSLTAILAPYVAYLIYEVTSVMANLGEIEGWQHAKGIRTVKTPKVSQTGTGSIQVTIIQMWTDSLAAEFDRNKIDSPTLCFQNYGGN